jgi:hypothetical protein
MMKTATSQKTGWRIRSEAITSAYETLKAFDGEREIFRLLESVRCLEYIFRSALQPALEEVRRGLYAGDVKSRRAAVASALVEVEEHLRYCGYID